MAQNPLIEQAKQGNVNAIASLMNRLLKSQGMLANVERDGDHLEVLIESDLRSLDDEVRIPKRQVLVGMLKKWFLTLEVQSISSITVSWQQTGFEEPAWTEEISLVERKDLNISENGGVNKSPERPRIPPLPVFPVKPMPNDERNDFSRDHAEDDNSSVASTTDLDEMFGDSSPNALPNLTPMQVQISELTASNSSQDSDFLILSDIPAVPNKEEISDFQSEAAFSFNSLSWQNLLTTSSFKIQFVQYLVVCGIIILTLRGIHAAFGSSKAPKAASVTTQIVLL